MNSYFIIQNVERKYTEIVTGITATMDDIDTMDEYLTKITTILKDRGVEFDADLKRNVDIRTINTAPGAALYILIGADIDERLTIRLYNTTNLSLDVFMALLVLITYGY